MAGEAEPRAIMPVRVGWFRFPLFLVSGNSRPTRRRATRYSLSPRSAATSRTLGRRLDDARSGLRLAASADRVAKPADLNAEPMPQSVYFRQRKFVDVGGRRTAARAPPALPLTARNFAATRLPTRFDLVLTRFALESLLYLRGSSIRWVDLAQLMPRRLPVRSQ